MTIPDPFEVLDQVEVIAHRGYSAVAPENTLVAVERALEAGADSVEFDLHVSSDGVPVLLHDETLERTTDGSGSVFDHDMHTLSRLDAGGWFDASYTGEPLPRLSEAMELCSAFPGRVYAEVKGLRSLDDMSRVVGAVRDSGLLERTVFISMDWDALSRARTVEASALLGYIVERPGRIEEAFQLAIGDGRALLDFDARILLAAPELTERAHEARVPLATWTVNEVSDAARLLELGVPRITTNEVGAMLEWKASRGEAGR